MTIEHSIPGRQIQHKTGYRAFVPDPLPPTVEWRPELLRSLSDADRLLGQLAGEGSQLPNPHLLIRPFVKREAVYSSRIEGTQATLGELLAAEAGAIVDRSPADLREVGNYVVALEHGRSRLKSLPLSLRLVRELHKKLMKGVHGPHVTPGEFRRSQNWIGPAGCTLMNASYVPPPPEELTNCLGAWEKFMHDRSLPPLIQAALLHYQFEAIHPFLDGNGRVGRLLIILFLVERNILPAPFLYISAFFDATRRDYYEGLKGVSSRGDWNGWLQYFLNGVARQAEDALSRAKKMNGTVSDWKKKVAGNVSAQQLMAVIDMVEANPFISINGVADRQKVAFTTAQRLIEKLRRFSILEQVGDSRRNRVFCAKVLLKILESPMTH